MSTALDARTDPATKKRVALIGGSFHPPTLDHGNVGQELLRLGLVDEVWYVPSANHPFAATQDKKKNMLPIEDRGEMLWSMISKFPEKDQMSVTFIEQTADLSGYTWETVAALKAQYGHDFYWVMGTDCVDDLSKWSKVPWLLENVTFIVYPRGGYPDGIGGYWTPLRAEHVVIAREDVKETSGSSSEARENPDGGLLDVDVATFWKGKHSV